MATLTETENELKTELTNAEKQLILLELQVSKRKLEISHIKANIEYNRQIEALTRQEELEK